MTRRIVVKGVKRSEISTEDLANIFYLQAKRRLRQRRECEARARAKRREREERSDRRSEDRR
jgi:hypothetical protein